MSNKTSDKLNTAVKGLLEGLIVLKLLDAKNASKRHISKDVINFLI